MNSKHRKTQSGIFADPVSGMIVWADVEAFLVACGCTIVEGNGSRVRFRYGDEIEIFHRPPPEKEANDIRSALFGIFSSALECIREYNVLQGLCGEN